MTLFEAFSRLPTADLSGLYEAGRGQPRTAERIAIERAFADHVREAGPDGVRTAWGRRYIWSKSEGWFLPVRDFRPKPSGRRPKAKRGMKVVKCGRGRGKVV